MRRFPGMGLALAALATVFGCGSFETELAPRVNLEVEIDDGSMEPFATDLGYQVELTSCRVAIANLQFSTEGEMHASLAPWRVLHDLVVPTASAHPGHAGGGEIVGEIPGRFVFDWRVGGETLGEGVFLQGQYDGLNFEFIRAEVSDGLVPDDPLVGHTFAITGQAARDGSIVEFELMLDQDEGRRVIGGVFEADIERNTAGRIALSMLPAVTQGTVLDGVDFAGLAPDDDGVVRIGPGLEEHAVAKRALQTHVHYEAQLQ